MTITRTLSVLGTTGLLLTVGAIAPAQAADEGLRSIQVSVANMTPGELVVQGAEVMSGEWISGLQPTQGSAVPQDATTQVGAMSTMANQGPAASFVLTGEEEPLTIAMSNPWAGSAAVHAVSTGSILATSTQVGTGSTAHADFTVTLAPSSASTRSAVAATGMRGSMRLTVDNRTDNAMEITDLLESSILSWRGAQPEVGDEVDGAESWRFENTDGRGDAGVLMTLTGEDDTRVIVAASMRADGSRSADVIHSEGVEARVVHSPDSGWRVIVSAA